MVELSRGYMTCKGVIILTAKGTYAFVFSCLKKDSLVAQLVKNLPAMQETLVRFLGWEDPLEKG